MSGLRVVSGLSLSLALAAPVFAQNVVSVRPGTINYVEGQATLGRNSQNIDNAAIGAISLGAGETVRTERGRVEVLLTPGVFLRIGQDSVVKMVSPSLVHTVVEVQRGRAEVEVDQIYDQNDLRVTVGSGPGASQTRLLKQGLYEFDADNNLLRVFDGKAEVSRDGLEQKPTTVKGGHQLALLGESTKTVGFNKKKDLDDLTAWNDVRSSYVGQEDAGLGAQPGMYGFNSAGYLNGGFGSYPWYSGAGFYSPYGLGLYGSSLYGGGFGYPGFGYPGFGFAGGYPGFGFGGYGGYGFGGYGGGYGGYGGGYGYRGVSGYAPGGVVSNRSGYRGQFSNRGGTGQPVVGTGGRIPGGRGTGSSGAARGGMAPSGGAPRGGGMAPSGGGFHGGGGGAGSAGGHSAGGGGGHR